MKVKARKVKAVSQCCGAPLSIGGEGSTHYFVCDKCGNPTDPKPADKTPDKGKPQNA